MPKFRVTSPDGETYEVTAPEGSTEQDAVNYVKSGRATKAPTPPTGAPPRSFATAPPVAAPPVAAPPSIPTGALPSDFNELDQFRANLGLDPASFKSQEPPPMSAEEVNRENLRTYTGPYEMLGGLVGGTLGAPFGPLGILGGGALGATAGAAAGRNIQDIKRFFGSESALPPPPSFQDRVTEIGRAGALDAAYGGGGALVGKAARAVGPGFARLFTGTTKPEALKQAEMAAAQGIDLGISDVSYNPVISGYQRIFGQFPGVGGPGVRQKRLQAKQLIDAIGRTTDEFRVREGTLPGGAKGMVKDARPLAETYGTASEEAVEAARQTFKKFTDDTKEKFNLFRNLAEKSNAQIPTKLIKEGSKKYVKDRRADIVKLADKGTLKPPVEDPALDWVVQLQKLPDSININQYERLTEDLDNLLNLAKKDANDIRLLLGLKGSEETPGSFEKALDNIQGDRAVRNALKDANAFYSENIGTFRTPTAKIFGRVDKNIFRPTYEDPGTKEADELMKALFNTKSPRSIRNLAKVLGQEEMSRAVGAFVKNAFNEGLAVKEPKTMIFDFNKFNNILHLDNPSGDQYKALKVALESTPLEIKDLEDMAQSIDLAFKDGLVDPSVFATRRIMFGGMPNLAEYATIAGFATNATLTAAAILAGRLGSSVLTNPKYLKALKRSLDPNLTDKARNNAGIRLLRLMGEDAKRDAQFEARGMDNRVEFAPDPMKYIQDLTATR